MALTKPKWNMVGPNVGLRTTTATMTTDQDGIDATTGAAWTLTLFTAVGCAGRIIRIKKTSSDTNLLTIDAAGTETINGSLTKVIWCQDETIWLWSDGSNWFVWDWKYDRTVTGAFTLTTWGITANQYGTLIALDLGPGIHSLSFHVYSDNTGATTASNQLIGWGTVTGNDGTGVDGASNAVEIAPIASGAGVIRNFDNAGFIVSGLTAITPYYLKGFIGTAITNIRVKGRITATRVGAE